MPRKKSKNQTKISENSLFLDELQFASSSKKDYLRRKKELAEGTLREIAPKIFTTNFEDADELIIRRNWKEILGHLYPGAVVSHRTAQELRPSEPDGFVHLTYTYTRRKELPGMTVFLKKGLEPQDDDIPLPGGLFVSSEGRKALENLEQASAKTHRLLSKVELEEWLERILEARGEDGLNRVRDRAKELSQGHWIKEFQKLDKIIGALLQTKPVRFLSSEVAKQRALGTPYDLDRVQIFDELFTCLMKGIYKENKIQEFTNKQRQAFSFFESYFSNFIEGTEFLIEEAKGIVFNGLIAESRPEDSHDILGVYRLVSDKVDFLKTPSDFEEFIKILKRRHYEMLLQRPSSNPGVFKEKENRAGETVFVAPNLVQGTLQKGFEYYQALPEGFARAAYVMFLVSEVHPFTDGNGRIARVMMNAELSANKEPRILIPIVYRTDYLLALRKLSRQKDPSVYIKMLRRTYDFSAQLQFMDIIELEKQLRESNCFKESEGNTLIF